jgi:hypothetical protein
MPSAIAYNHPSLVLGNIVDTKLLDFMSQMSRRQSDIDAAHDTLNSLVQMKRSIAMTVNELKEMNIDMSETEKRQTDIDNKIKKLAANYMSIRMDGEEKIQQIIADINKMEIKNDLESIVDFSSSVLKTYPLSSESLNMDSQFFSFDGDVQNDMMANIEKFVRTSTGNNRAISDKTASEVSSQITSQIQNHNISGTLIIVASCTHRNVQMFQPLIIDPDKAVLVWNNIFNGDKIILPRTMDKLPELQNDKLDNSLSVIVGATYGSSFVGMVHILKSETNRIDDFEKIKANLENKLRIGGWMENNAGGFGINESVLNDVKAILSSRDITCHISIITAGAIPSIKSKELSLSMSKLINYDEKTITNVVNIGKAETPTTDSDAKEAQEKAMELKMQNERLNAIIKNMSSIDRDKNKAMDINTLMDAFENYITSISAKNEIVGSPVSFHVKRITKADIYTLWSKKYFTLSRQQQLDDSVKNKEKMLIQS